MENKNIYLILGASSDVGVDLIKQLNQHQNNSFFLAHYHSNSKILSELEMTHNNSIRLYNADLSNVQDVESMVKEIESEYGIPTHIIHLPAEKYSFTKLKDVKWSSILKDAEIQVHSLLYILQKFLPKMAKGTGYRKILIMLSENTTSLPAKYTMQYTIVKYMLLGMLKALAVDYEKKQVNINGISPSMMNTKFLSNIDPRLLEMSGSTMMNAENVIPVMEFLLSQESNYINGVNLNITN